MIALPITPSTPTTLLKVFQPRTQFEIFDEFIIVSLHYIFQENKKKEESYHVKFKNIFFDFLISNTNHQLLKQINSSQTELCRQIHKWNVADF